MVAFRLLLCCCVAAVAIAADDDWEMRPRVFCDPVAGITFRYPYELYAPDQYKPELTRQRRFTEAAESELKEIEIDGKMVKVVIQREEAPRIPDVRAFSAIASTLPAEVAGGSLAVVGNHLAGRKLSWSPFTYYGKSEERPHANPTTAPKDIQAMIADSAEVSALVVKHGDRYSGLVLSGALKDRSNQVIVDSFEVTIQGKGKQPPVTWRETQGRANKVTDPLGRLVATTAKLKSVSWTNAWDLETAHYHVTTQVSPARLAQYGVFLEALYKSYSQLYNPEVFPPVKMEIHVFNTHDEFMAAAAAHGFAIGPGVGGFFVPMLLSIFVYEEVNKASAATVEEVLAHECSHQFLHVTCNGSRHVPTWINEGLAVYFESGVFQNGQFQVRPPRDRINRLRDLYESYKTTLMPLEKYLAYYRNIPGDNYGEVYAMTAFFLFGTCQGGFANCKHKECGLAHFRDYWKALKRQEDGTKAFEEYFMKDMIKAKGSREAAIAAWQQVYFNYVMKELR